MEDDLTGVAGGQDGWVVGHISISKLQSSIVGASNWRQAGEVAGVPDERPDNVAVSEQGVTKPPT